MSFKKNILFIFHETNRTGSSLVLLNYVKSLSTENSYNMLFYVMHDGPLTAELEKLGKVFYPDSFKSFPERNAFNKITTKLLSKDVLNVLITELQKTRIDLIVANTLASANLIIHLKKNLSSPAAWYIHELGLAASKISPKQYQAAPLVDFWIANSEATLRFIKERYGVADKKCFVLPPQIILPNDLNANTEVKNKKGKFIIGSSGSVTTSKGYHLFILLAKMIKKMDVSDRFRFKWVGNCSHLRDEIDYDLERCGLKEYVKFTGETATPFSYYSDFDIFVSTSKEESFGLACIESAYIGKPVIGFEGTGGLEEIIKGCKGELVPYMDIHKMAELILEISGSNERMTNMGNASKQFALQYSSSELNLRWNKMIRSIINMS